jgi:PIN domain nuclease of toxin-antitoxin system
VSPVRAIIDSNIFLFLLSDPASLSPTQTTIVSDSANELFLSFASVWEIIIKSGLGKVRLPAPPDQLFTTHLAQFSVQLLPLTLAHLLQVHTLPLHHRDPFDRLIIAQVILEKVPVLSSDSQFPAYGIQVIA